MGAFLHPITLQLGTTNITTQVQVGKGAERSGAPAEASLQATLNRSTKSPKYKLGRGQRGGAPAQASLQGHFLRRACARENGLMFSLHRAKATVRMRWVHFFIQLLYCLERPTKLPKYKLGRGQSEAAPPLKLPCRATFLRRACARENGLICPCTGLKPR